MCIVFTSFYDGHYEAVGKGLEEGLQEGSHIAFRSQANPKVWRNFGVLCQFQSTEMGGPVVLEK